MGVLIALWQLRFPIAIILALGAGAGVYLRIWSLEIERDAAEASLRKAVEANAVTVATLESLSAEKKRNETLLADRAARKSKEADQLSAIIKRINEQNDQKSCPSMPIIDGVIDGLY